MRIHIAPRSMLSPITKAKPSRMFTAERTSRSVRQRFMRETYPRIPPHYIQPSRRSGSRNPRRRARVRDHSRSPPMRDLIDPRLMYLKAWLFLLAGCVAAGLLVMESPSLRTVALIAITVWAFSRLYYFLFY